MVAPGRNKVLVEAVMDVVRERSWQVKKHGPQLNEGDDYRLKFTLEEFGEVGRALYELENAERNGETVVPLYAHLYEELTQTAACLVAWMEYLKRTGKVQR